MYKATMPVIKVTVTTEEMEMIKAWAMGVPIAPMVKRLVLREVAKDNGTLRVPSEYPPSTLPGPCGTLRVPSEYPAGAKNVPSSSSSGSSRIPPLESQDPDGVGERYEAWMLDIDESLTKPIGEAMRSWPTTEPLSSFTAEEKRDVLRAAKMAYQECNLPLVALLLSARYQGSEPDMTPTGKRKKKFGHGQLVAWATNSAVQMVRRQRQQDEAERKSMEASGATEEELAELRLRQQRAWTEKAEAERNRVLGVNGVDDDDPLAPREVPD